MQDLSGFFNFSDGKATSVVLVLYKNIHYDLCLKGDAVTEKMPKIKQWCQIWFSNLLIPIKLAFLCEYGKLSWTINDRVWFAGDLADISN